MVQHALLENLIIHVIVQMGCQEDIANKSIIVSVVLAKIQACALTMHRVLFVNVIMVGQVCCVSRTTIVTM